MTKARKQGPTFFNFLQGLKEGLSVVLLEDLQDQNFKIHLPWRRDREANTNVAETMEKALEEDGNEDYNRADDGDDPCRSVLQRYVRLVASSGHGSR